MGRVLGELEHLLLLALLRAGGDAAGIELRDDLEARTGRSVLPARRSRRALPRRSSHR